MKFRVILYEYFKKKIYILAIINIFHLSIIHITQTIISFSKLLLVNLNYIKILELHLSFILYFL